MPVSPCRQPAFPTDTVDIQSIMREMHLRPVRARGDSRKEKPLARLLLDATRIQRARAGFRIREGGCVMKKQPERESSKGGSGWEITLSGKCMHCKRARRLRIFLLIGPFRNWPCSSFSLVSRQPSCRMQPQCVCDEIYPFMCRVKSNIQAKERRALAFFP